MKRLPHARRLGEECRALRFGIAGDVARPIADDEFASAIRLEGLASEPPFFLAGEQHAGGVAEDAPLEQPPEDTLEEGLGRIGAVEPRIKHAVREDEIRRCAVEQGAPGAERRVIPQSVYDYGVVLRRMVSQPTDQPRRSRI